MGFLLPVAVCFASVRVGFCVALCEREINDDGVRDVRPSPSSPSASYSGQTPASGLCVTLS